MLRLHGPRWLQRSSARNAVQVYGPLTVHTVPRPQSIAATSSASRPEPDKQRQCQHQWCHVALTATQQGPTGSTSASSTAKADDAAITNSDNKPDQTSNATGAKHRRQSFFNTPQAAAFMFLSVISAIFGAAALAAPQQLLLTALGTSGTPLEVAFTRIAGATMAISAAAEYSLQDAVTAGHLKSATYQRLMLAIIAKNALYLTAFTLSPELWNPVLVSIYPTSALVSVATNAATLQTAFKQSGIAAFGEGLQIALQGSIGVPSTTAGWVYSAFTLLYIATVAACYAPEVIFTGDGMTPATELLKHTWSPGFLLSAAACVVLRDAADRNRLAASTFRRLNLGLVAMETGYSLVFAWSIYTGLAVNDSSSWSNLGGSVCVAAYCLHQYLTQTDVK
eukprot:GHRR01005712.1.p1 GENE.GHRR01005712.1~~GHRR01005712.1.p1  ORF type:complete len:394 (+),score=124.42 GHRR01005712.1:253-1434(+)